MFFVQIAGHLGKDPETRFTASGQKVTSFSVAINHRKNKEETVTIWVRVTVWGDKMEKVLSFLKKGSAVIISGRMMPPSNYVDKEGRNQTSLEVTAEVIEFSPFGKEGRSSEQQGHQAAPSQQNDFSYTHSQANEEYAYQPARNQSYGSDVLVGQGSGTRQEEEIPF